LTDSFTIVHITDFHVGDPRGLLENIQETIGWKSIKKCIEEINLLHPDFVIISGDLVYGQLYPFEYRIEYETCYEMIQHFDVPTFLVPGNHDGYNRILEDGLEFWEEYFGPHYYSFDYGSAHFQALNSYDMNKFQRLTFLVIPLNWGGSFSDEQIQWISQDLQEHEESSLLVQFMHHNPIWNTQGDSLMSKGYTHRDTLLALNKAFDVDLVCAGHVHYDSVSIENDTIYLTTTTPESEIRVSDGYWGYRMIEIQNGEIISYNYKEPKYSIPSYHLSIKQMNISGMGLAEIQNELEMDINAHVKFVLPLGSYHTTSGEITMQRNKGMLTELYITAPVPAQSSSVILVSAV
jgi:predicted MPP superfamily phosphohydrolase